jgi:hypothetical protein
MTKIRPVGAEFHAGGQTRHEFNVTFRNFGNAPKKMKRSSKEPVQTRVGLHLASKIKACGLMETPFTYDEEDTLGF